MASIACRVCGWAASKACAACSDVFYCGPECQREDWLELGHRQACKSKQHVGGVYVDGPPKRLDDPPVQVVAFKSAYKIPSGQWYEVSRGKVFHDPGALLNALVREAINYNEGRITRVLADPHNPGSWFSERQSSFLYVNMDIVRKLLACTATTIDRMASGEEYAHTPKELREMISNVINYSFYTTHGQDPYNLQHQTAALATLTSPVEQPLGQKNPPLEC